MENWVVVGVVVEKDGKFLITQQAPGCFHEGKWAIPGGMIEPKLSIIENAIKEAKEETKLDIDVKSLVGVYKMELEPKTEKDPSGLLIYIVLKATAQEGEVTIREGEISDYRWVTIEELKSFPKSKLRPVMNAVVESLSKGEEYSLEVVQG